MSLGITFPGDDWVQIGAKPARECILTPDTSYPTGGYTFGGALVGGASTGGLGAANNGMVGVDPLGQNTAAVLYQLVFNAQTGKIQILTAGAEVANATDLSALIFYVLALVAGQ